MTSEEELKLIGGLREDIAKLIIEYADKNLSPSHVSTTLMMAAMKVISAECLALTIRRASKEETKDPLMKPMKMPKGGWS